MISKELIKSRLPFLYRCFLWTKRVPLREMHLLTAFFSDYRRYRRYSYRYNRSSSESENLEALIMKYSHSLEKGFSLPEIRPGYGRAVIDELIRQLKLYKSKGFDSSEISYRKAQSVLAEYLRYHDGIGFNLNELRERILPWVDECSGIAGYDTVAVEEIHKGSRGDFESCALSRSSIRSYSKEPVPAEVIRHAIGIASHTPSACNRQCWHTYVVRDHDLKAQVLELQNGNRGFGSQSDFLVIITADIRGFAGAGERYGNYIDGGLYAMSLIYAFHFCGVGVCPLNWMVMPDMDRRLKKLLKLSPSENVIMLLSGGNLPDQVRIAKSIKKGVDELLTFL